MSRKLVAALVGALLVASAVVEAGDGPRSVLENARAGQWVLRKRTASGFIAHLYAWIDAVEGRKVHRKVQLLGADGASALTPAIEEVIDLDAPLPEGDGTSEPRSKSGAEELDYRGKKLRCARTETTTDSGGLRLTTTVWTSPEVPFDGIVKLVVVDMDGKEVDRLETLDHGETGAAEKPVRARGGE